MSLENVIFAIVVLAAAGLFAYNVQRLISYLRIARPDPRWDYPLARLGNVSADAAFNPTAAGPS